MKKYFYIFLFTLLGFLGQFFIHAIIEMNYISLLTSEFETYSFGLSWDTWFMIHHIGTAILAILGIAIGFQQGKYWWQKLYIERNRT